jgi:hypothetical protein
MMRLMRAIWQIRHDTWRVVRGLSTFVSYLRAGKDIEVGLGLFAAASHFAARHRPNRYTVRIANASQDERETTLSVDIYTANLSREAAAHYAFFTKRLTVHPQTASTITIQYDWLSGAHFVVDGVSCPPDHLWKGHVDTPQLCSVSAVLWDSKETQLDRLTLYQEFTG